MTVAGWQRTVSAQKQLTVRQCHRPNTSAPFSTSPFLASVAGAALLPAQATFWEGACKTYITMLRGRFTRHCVVAYNAPSCFFLAPLVSGGIITCQRMSTGCRRTAPCRS